MCHGHSLCDTERLKIRELLHMHRQLAILSLVTGIHTVQCSQSLEPPHLLISSAYEEKHQVSVIPTVCGFEPRCLLEEDPPHLHLLQLSHGIYSVDVPPGGIPEEALGDNTEALTADSPLLKPSQLAFGESEAEDLDTIQLLQTSRDLMLSPKASDSQPTALLGLQTNTSLIHWEPGVVHADAAQAREDQTYRNARALSANPQTMEHETELMVNTQAVKAVHSAPLDIAVALRDGSGVHHSMIDAIVPLFVVCFLVLLLLLFAVGVGKLGTWCFNVYRCSEESSLRAHVENMRRSPGLEVVDQLIEGGVYDCAIMRPLSSRQLIRLEARVEEAASGFCLFTPLTQQACVRFNSTVSGHVNGTSPPVPMSHHSASIDFIITLLDAPHVRIEIEGKDLSTFDMSAGRLTAKRTFDSAARHWQEFAMTYQIGGKAQPAARFRSENAVLEFQETAIGLGTSITIIGELQRNAFGTLLLRPAIQDADENVPPQNNEAWRTSWETPPQDSQDTKKASLRVDSRKPWLGKVWVSDDPTLLGASHKHAKYDPAAQKASRDCTSQISGGFVHLVSSGGP